MKETLRQIFDRYGIDVFRNGSRLLSFYADLAPRDKRGKQLLSSFLQCSGNEQLIAALGRPAPEQASAIHIVINQMTSGLSIAQDAAQEVCCAFWLAIGGKPVDLSVPSEKKSVTPPTPQPAPDIKPANPPKLRPAPRKPNGTYIVVGILIVVLLLTVFAVLPHGAEDSPESSGIPDGTFVDKPEITVPYRQLKELRIIEDSLETLVQFSYDERGNLIRMTKSPDESYSERIFEYDENNRLLQISVPYGDELDFYPGCSNFSYDEKGLLKYWNCFEFTMGRGVFDFFYDSSRLSQASMHWTDMNVSSNYSLSYNEAGKIQSVDRITNDNNTAQEAISASTSELFYDDRGRIVSVNHSDQNFPLDSTDYWEQRIEYFGSDIMLITDIFDEENLYQLCTNTNIFSEWPLLAQYHYYCASEGSPTLWRFSDIENISTDESGYITSIDGQSYTYSFDEHPIRIEFNYAD